MKTHLFPLIFLTHIFGDLYDTTVTPFLCNYVIYVKYILLLILCGFIAYIADYQ